MEIRSKYIETSKGKSQCSKTFDKACCESLTSDKTTLFLHDIDAQHDKFFHSVNRVNMWSILTRNWNPSSIYEITSTVNNRTSKSTAKTVKEMTNFSSKNKNILMFYI